MTEAEARYASAMNDIRKGLTIAQGATGAESRAQAAYSAMVTEGTASPLRAKYRKGRFLKQVR